ncbi:hypothetical protein ONJ23_27165, partial [Salmonella enterica subsp. enterica serovar Virginia]|nr:hypothetical protein [Salmonella enterica subsp. enterica serovar Virginia]
AMINAAKRPVLYLGGGVINAPTRVRELAEKAQLPTTMTLMALVAKRAGCFGVDFNIGHDFAPVFLPDGFHVDAKASHSPCAMKTT